MAGLRAGSEAAPALAIKPIWCYGLEETCCDNQISQVSVAL